MKKGVKITLIVSSSVIALCGIGYIIYRATKKNEIDFNSKGTNGESMIGSTNSQGYTYIDASKTGTEPKVGEHLYALKNATIQWRNYADTNSKNYKEWTTNVTMGQDLGAIQKVTSNCIFMKNATLNKNDECIKRASGNEGKIGVLRDANGNPLSQDEVKRGLNVNWSKLVEFGVDVYNKISSQKESTQKESTQKD